VSVRGPVDERTGYVMDLGVLKRIVEAEFVDRVDHRNLNADVEFMRGNTFLLPRLLVNLNSFSHLTSLIIHLQSLTVYLNVFESVELYLITDLTLLMRNIHTVLE